MRMQYDEEFELRNGAVERAVAYHLEQKGLTRAEAEQTRLVVHQRDLAHYGADGRRLSQIEEIAYFAYFVFVPQGGLVAPSGFSPKSLVVAGQMGPFLTRALTVAVMTPDASAWVTRSVWIDALDEEATDFASSVKRLQAAASEIVVSANHLLPAARAAAAELAPGG